MRLPQLQCFVSFVVYLLTKGKKLLTFTSIILRSEQQQVLTRGNLHSGFFTQLQLCFRNVCVPKKDSSTSSFPSVTTKFKTIFKSSTSRVHYGNVCSSYIRVLLPPSSHAGPLWGFWIGICTKKASGTNFFGHSIFFIGNYTLTAPLSFWVKMFHFGEDLCTGDLSSKEPSILLNCAKNFIVHKSLHRPPKEAECTGYRCFSWNNFETCNKRQVLPWVLHTLNKAEMLIFGEMLVFLFCCFFVSRQNWNRGPSPRLTCCICWFSLTVSQVHCCLRSCWRNLRTGQEHKETSMSPGQTQSLYPFIRQPILTEFRMQIIVCIRNGI